MQSLVLAGAGVAQDPKVAGSLSTSRPLVLLAKVAIAAVLLRSRRVPGAVKTGLLALGGLLAIGWELHVWRTDQGREAHGGVLRMAHSLRSPVSEALRRRPALP